MRLRATLVSTGIFAKMLGCLEKADKLLLKFTATRLYLMSPGEGGGLSMWGDLETDTLFEDYLIESASGNEIYLDVSCGHLLSALKTTSQSAQTTLRLTKQRGLAVLALSLRDCSATETPILLTHEIPVKVVPPQYGARYQPPNPPIVSTSCPLPSIGKMKHFVERVKAWSQWVTLSANSTGTLLLSIETQQVSIQSRFFPGLLTRDTSAYAPFSNEARIEARSLLTFLGACLQIHPNSVTCRIVDDQCVLLLAVLGGVQGIDCGSLLYVLPVRRE